jgi:hypothetical protein
MNAAIGTPVAHVTIAVCIPFHESTGDERKFERDER